jgi:hypothetical protein
MRWNCWIIINVYTNFIVKTNCIEIESKFLTFVGIGTSARGSSRFSLLTIIIGPFPFCDDLIRSQPSVTSPNLSKKNWTNETNFRSAMLCLHLRFRLLRLSFWKMKYQIAPSALHAWSFITFSPKCGTSCTSCDRGTKPNDSVQVSKGSSLNQKNYVFNLFANFLV